MEEAEEEEQVMISISMIYDDNIAEMLPFLDQRMFTLDGFLDRSNVSYMSWYHIHMC